MTSRAVFLDRDGVLNSLVSRPDGLYSPQRSADFHLVADAGPAVATLRQHGFKVFVVTNQPDIARGKMPVTELEAMHALLQSELEVDEVAVCTHDDRDECACRKPKPGMLTSLGAKHSIEMSASWMIGDSWRDVAAGEAAGCRTVLVGGSVGGGGGALPVTPDFIARDLESAVVLVVS